MQQPQPIDDRRTSAASGTNLPPREDFGRVAVPLLGDVDIALGLGRPLRLEIDEDALELQFGGGLDVRPTSLPPIGLRRLYVDLVHGVVETDSDGLGGFFAGALSVALCSVLRHTLGWKPGASAVKAGAAKFAGEVQKDGHLVVRRRFPDVRATVDPHSVLSVELRGDALEVTASRPLVVRALGLSVRVLKVRWVFATASFEVVNEPLGPVRRGVVRLATKRATRWLRQRLPAAMVEPGYDLFADPERLDHLVELVHRLRSDDRKLTGGEHLAGEEGTPAHPFAREAAKGAAGLFSGVKAAITAGLTTLRISAEDPPEATRALATIPLGPFSSLALATDRGSDVVVSKGRSGLRLEAAQGIYIYTDQFPELAELRLLRSRVRFDDDDLLAVDVHTEPSLGPFLEALVQRVCDRYVSPLIPVAWLRDKGIIAPTGEGEELLLWKQGLGDSRQFLAGTRGGAEVELRHQDDALVFRAPAGLSLRFPGLPQLPAAEVRRIAYRWADGALEIDGDPGLGPFGQAVLAEIARTRAAPHAPAGLGVPREGGPELDEARLADFSQEVFALGLPLVGKLQLRMHPEDTLGGLLGPASLAVESERGLMLVAADLGLAIELRRARYDLRTRTLELDSSPPTGDYLNAVAVACLETYVIPALRRAVPLWPDADPERTWLLSHVLSGMLGKTLGLAFDLSLPPGAALTAGRVPGSLQVGATAPLQVRPVDESLIGEFAVEAIRWRPDGEQIELTTTPPAGPLLHAVLRRFHAHFTPKLVLHAVAERLGLPRPFPPAPAPPAPASAPLVTASLPLCGSLALHVDRQHPGTLTLSREGARLEFGEGMVFRLPEVGIHVAVRTATISLMPFTVEITSQPAAGELDSWLLSHVVRGLFARVLQWFWPTHHATAGGQDVLLAFAADRSWGPLEVCTPPGGSLELGVDAEGLALRSRAGASFAGPALAWLPKFALHEWTYRFADGAVHLDLDGIEQRHYDESEPVSPGTEAVLADLMRVLLLPHAPGWAQRLGLRILPQPPVPQREPGRVTVVQAQLPGGFAQVQVHVDPSDVLVVGANRHEIWFDSERHIHCDVPGLRLHLDLDRARYHLGTGEVQVGEFGQLENALIEAALRRVLIAFEPSAARSEMSALAAVLDRFPVDDEGRRVLYNSGPIRVLLRPDTALVIRLSERGFLLNAEPPLEIDGPSVLDYRFGGLLYSFDDASFHLDVERDGLIAGLLRRPLVGEGERQLDSLLRPILPEAMRTPGYRLALDPNPSETIAALIRTVVGGGYLLTS